MQRIRTVGRRAFCRKPSTNIRQESLNRFFEEIVIFRSRFVVSPPVHLEVGNGLVRSHRGQEHARGRRCEMLCLRADLRHKAEAAVVRTDEVTRAPGQSAGDLPVRRCGRREGVAAVSEPGVRALAKLVSRRDAAQGGGFAHVILRMRTGSNAIALQSRSHLEHRAKTRFAAYDKYLLVAGAAAGMATLCFPFIRCLCWPAK